MRFFSAGPVEHRQEAVRPMLVHLSGIAKRARCAPDDGVVRSKAGMPVTVAHFEARRVESRCREQHVAEPDQRPRSGCVRCGNGDLMEGRAPRFKRSAC